MGEMETDLSYQILKKKTSPFCFCTPFFVLVGVRVMNLLILFNIPQQTCSYHESLYKELYIAFVM